MKSFIALVFAWGRPACGLLMGFALTGCTTVRVVAPNPQVESPEVRRDESLAGGLLVSNGHLYTASGDGSARPPDLSHPDLSAQPLADGRFLYSPWQPIAFGSEIHIPSDGSVGINGFVKYQFNGRGGVDADVGDVPIGIYLKVGDSYSSVSGDQNFTFGPGGFPWHGTVNVSYIHAGGSAGYRFSKRTLLYGGFAVGQYFARAEVDQNLASDGTAGGSYKISDHGFAETVGAGLQFSFRYIQLFTNAGYSHVDYNLTPVSNQVNVLLGMMVFTK